MKAVMISIKPKYCELIASGKKTIEVRKTVPKEVPFRVFIYCKKDNKTAFNKHTDNMFLSPKGWQIYSECNGKVIGSFVCDCVTPLYNVCFDDWERLHGGIHKIEKQLTEMACLTEAELHKYAKGKNCFAWHISELKIYDKPKELSEFAPNCKYKGELCECCTHFVEVFGGCCNTIKRPPRSWMYVEELP